MKNDGAYGRFPRVHSGVKIYVRGPNILLNEARSGLNPAPKPHGDMSTLILTLTLTLTCDLLNSELVCNL